MIASKLKPLAALLAGSALLVACGGGSSSDGGGGASVGAGTNIGGSVSAPAGAVAMLGARDSVLIAIRDFMFNRAHAAITGLMPVEGALVELIRVDDQGDQVGQVLASTATSITGDYSLTVPAGINLAGNLIVRISGRGSAEMRAQVVEQEVDINPVSEFVLQKFIDEGADLDNLTTASIIKLTGQVEEFDLVAGADLGAMLAALERETGAFVENQISLIESTPGSGVSIVGNYRGAEFGAGLHDDDQRYDVGTLSIDGGVFEFALSDQGDGEVALAIGLEEDFYSNQTFFGNDGNVELSYIVEIENGDGERETARIDGDGVLSIETEFEEDIDGDYSWREPPSLLRLQKAANTNVFVGTETGASVRYQTIDTNDDGIKDAVDPAAREGDEAFKSLIVVAEQPATMTTADLSGEFGRVYSQLRLGSNGAFNVRVGHNTLSFDGVGSFDGSAEQNAELDRTAAGLSYIESTEAGETGVPYAVSENGRVFTVNGESEDSLFNDNFDLFVSQNVSARDDDNSEDTRVNEVEFSASYAVKLPSAQLDISNRVYRLFFLGVSLGPQSTALATARFTSLLTMNNDGLSAMLSNELLDIEKASSTAEVDAHTDDDVVNVPASVNLTANGEATLVVSDPEGAFTLNGYFSHDGSLGLFQSRYADTGEDPDELGVAILVEVDSAE